jgi:hypothetical protein
LTSHLRRNNAHVVSSKASSLDGGVETPEGVERRRDELRGPRLGRDVRTVGHRGTAGVADGGDGLVGGRAG